ncbi:uncharacterized protein LAJ45_02201 [Morchella importuna]|uniref:Uncharacterized protein n=1 Tax=Morchella conica CCBAS932 TaxID=1392247 RepID=A0A3N4L5D0_9PEZI|nr:uncharacterized protein LAJ45_02201 [Morchella importuna]KAH8153389.1 hypothetical protein LAJ45_02201 [Morchella importuna]RPB13245.1 hypothetical protein P167DRAFT_564740 [Morchella conica CCBAS932]
MMGINKLLSFLLLQILFWALPSASEALPEPVAQDYGVSTTTTTTKPTPTPTPYFKLRVWNHWRAQPHFEGTIELNFGGVFYNLTQNPEGFDVYFDQNAPGMIRQKESAAYAALIPGATNGLYTFHFVTRVRSPNVLWKYFSFRWLVCGQCSGQYLVYDLPGAGPNASSNFLMAPDTSKPGAWRVYWNNNNVNSQLPPGSVRIEILK